MEKPLGRNELESRAIVDLFENAGLPLFVAYYRRGLAPFTTARELIASGTLGAPVSVSFRLGAPANPPSDALPWRLTAAESGGGLFCDTGVHVLDVIEFIMGEPLIDVAGSAANVGSPWLAVEDSVSMSFGFTSSSAGDDFQTVTPSSVHSW